MTGMTTKTLYSTYRPMASGTSPPITHLEALLCEAITIVSQSQAHMEASRRKVLSVTIADSTGVQSVRLSKTEPPSMHLAM